LKCSKINFLILKNFDCVTTKEFISDEIGRSIGKVNFVLQALLEKSLIKSEIFFNNQNKK
jgi:hypothetical protein